MNAPMASDATSRTPSRLRRLVLTEQERTRAQLAALTVTFDELVAAADLEPPDDEHDPDGTTAYERAQVSSLIEVARSNLVGLRRTLARLDEGTASVCAACGATIAGERLLALPTTDRCVRCAR